MAKTATATKAKPASSKSVPTGKKSTTTASSIADDLSALVATNKALEDEQRAQMGSQNSFITLVKANSKIVDPNEKEHYIKGVKPLDYVIASKKLALGKALDVTILGMYKVYSEVKKKERESEMAKTVKFWLPEDAENFPVEGMFDRPLPNGNILQPGHWLHVYLHEHPEIEDAYITFRSKGNSIYTALTKVIKAESKLCTELRFKVTSQAVQNKAYDKIDYYPKFEIVGRNYSVDDSGKVTKPKDSKLDAETLKRILILSQECMEGYSKGRLVGKQNVQALLGAPVRPALPAGKAEYKEDEDEAVNF